MPSDVTITVPDGHYVVVVKGLHELMYWLDRCYDKGHLENCSDLIEPYEKFEWAVPTPKHFQESS